MPDIDYRRITEPDAPAFQRALNAVIEEKRFLGSGRVKTEQQVTTFVRSVLEHQFPQQIALAGEQLVGWCDITPPTRDFCSHVGCVGMGVVMNYRRQGIGSVLLTKCLVQAQQSGIEKIELEVYADNAGAIALYERTGFHVEGTRRRARRYDGVYQDIVHMARFC